MKKLFYVVAIAAVFTLTACEKDDFKPESTPQKIEKAKQYDGNSVAIDKDDWEIPSNG